MRELLRDFRNKAKVTEKISRTEYARTLRIPSGPKQGMLYDPETQPVCNLILKELDRDYWPVLLFLWSVQSGKSFSFVNVETLYIAEVLCEDQIIGLPDKPTVKKKWKEISDLIRVSGKEWLLPKQGEGSKEGGEPTLVVFSNGARLEFMTGGTSDSGRSASTARHVCVDEIDKQGVSQSTSEETSPIKQYQARQRAYPEHMRRFRGTSTVAGVDGFLWQSHLSGSCGRVLMPCHACGEFVYLERNSLQGWQESQSEIDAMQKAYLVCPECGNHWNESQRIVSVKKAVICHKGQKVSKNGKVIGNLPETLVGTVISNWTCDILGKDIPEITRAEWISRAQGKPEKLELEIDQFSWVVPKQSQRSETIPITVDTILNKEQAKTRHRIVPDDTEQLVLGVDMHSRYIRFVAGAQTADQSATIVIDYGKMDSGWMVLDEKEQKERISGLEQEGKKSWFKMLDRLFDRCYLEGWTYQNGHKRFPDRVYIDTRYNNPKNIALDDKFIVDEWIESLYKHRFEEDGEHKIRCKFCRQQFDKNAPFEVLNLDCSARMSRLNGIPDAERFRMIKGTGQGELQKRTYRGKSGPGVEAQGEYWHLVRTPENRMYFYFDSDYSKTQSQNRFFRSPGTHQTLLLYKVDTVEEHRQYALEMTAKRWVMDKATKKFYWHEDRTDDHYLDATGYMVLGMDIEAIYRELENLVNHDAIDSIIQNSI